eukprot:3774762-Pyramimonas_sp.AAC.1
MGGNLTRPLPMLLRLPAQPRQAPMPAGSIMTESGRGRMSLGLRNPPRGGDGPGPSSSLAAARAMATAPG